MIVVFVFSICLHQSLGLNDQIYYRDEENSDGQTIFHDDTFTGKFSSKSVYGPQYNDILNVLHNDESNKQLLDKINKNAPQEAVPWEVTGNGDSDLVIIRYDSDEDKDLDEYRRKRSVIENPEIKPNLKIKRDTGYQINLNKIFKEGLNIKGLKRLRRSNEANNIEVFNKVKNNEEPIRPKRDSAIKLLNDLFVGEIAPKSDEPTTKDRSVFPINIKQSYDININSTLVNILINLTNSIEKFNENLNKYNMKLASNNQGFVIMKVPPQNDIVLRNGTRRKREVNTDITENTTFLGETTSVDVKEKITTRNVKDEIVKKEDNQTQESKFENTTQNVEYQDGGTTENAKTEDEEITSKVVSNEKENVTQDSNSNENSMDKIPNTEERDRNEFNETKELDERSFDLTNGVDQSEDKVHDKDNTGTTTIRPIARTTLESRENLIEYIKHVFEEIKDKIYSINYVKEKFSSDKMYKLGYIVATIDSVNLTISKLNKKLDANRNIWEIKKLQQVFRKLDLSNGLLADVISNLDMYVRK